MILHCMAPISAPTIEGRETETETCNAVFNLRTRIEIIDELTFVMNRKQIDTCRTSNSSILSRKLPTQYDRRLVDIVMLESTTHQSQPSLASSSKSQILHHEDRKDQP